MSKRCISLDCPKCGNSRARVISKRTWSLEIYRRRECLKCQHRFSTYEVVPNRLKAETKMWPTMHKGRRNRDQRTECFNALAAKPKAIAA